MLRVELYRMCVMRRTTRENGAIAADARSEQLHRRHAPDKVNRGGLVRGASASQRGSAACYRACDEAARRNDCALGRDRKSTRLNSSHGSISYAVFCLKKKNNASGGR